MVIGNHAVLLFKDGTLWLKHRMVHQQAVREDDGFWAAAGLFVKKIDAVNLDCWHFVFNPDPERSERGGNPIVTNIFGEIIVLKFRSGLICNFCDVNSQDFEPWHFRFTKLS